MPPCFLNGTDSTSWNILSFDDASDALPLGVRDSLAGFFSASPKILVLTKGMSVVGPRPVLPNKVAAYNDYQRQRLLVKPGMTCSWQTRCNRDPITFDEWVDLDLWRWNRPACPERRHSGGMMQVF